MELQFAFLCDYADQGPGKMTAVGIGIDTIYTKQVPLRHPLLFAVLGMRFSIVEVGPKQLGAHIIDTDGRDIVPALEATVSVDPPASGFTYRSLRVALGLQGIEFPRFGEYAVSFLIDHHEVARSPIRVIQLPMPPSTG